MTPPRTSARAANAALKADARIGNTVIEVKSGVEAVRTVREGLFQLAYYIAEEPRLRGVLVLEGSTVTPDRLRAEWRRAGLVFKPGVMARLGVLVGDHGRYTGIPRPPESGLVKKLAKIVDAEREKSIAPARIDYGFVVSKLLILRWLSSDEPVTTEWLKQTAGCSYPTIARSLRTLGGLIERTSDRRVRLRWLPKEELARLRAVSARARTTTRFADRSGQPRTVKSHLRRLERLGQTDIAIGGVMGATQYVPDLDLAGTPRLNLSIHCPRGPMDVSFVVALDPALKPVRDPLEPATVVVHAVRHVEPFFEPRAQGLQWADRVECLFDLYEAGFERQGDEFLSALEAKRSS